MKPLKVLITALLLLTFSLSYAQKSTMEKANELYKLESYAEAIPLFQKALANKESLPGRTKLAYSLMILNRMEDAEKEYRQIIEEPRLRSSAYLQFGQVLMSLEKYAEAKKYFLKYAELEPDKEEGTLMANACDKVPFIESFFQDVTFEPYPFNTDVDDTAPVFYNNGIVFSSDRNPGLKFLKQKSATTGRDYMRLYFSKMKGEGIYQSPKSFSTKINELNKNVATATFSADATEVYFTKNGNTANRRNAYALQLFKAERGGLKWKGAKIVSFCRPNYNYMHPCISPDGRTLFFTSDKPSGEGGTDIYYSKRKKGKWGKPRNLGSKINTSMHEGFPFMHSDGKLYFCSKGHVGFGGYDIFMTEQNENGEWKEPINLGKPINSSHDDVSIYLNTDSISGFFTSSREGGDDDIYLFKINDGPFEVSPNEIETEVVAINTSEKKQVFESSEVPVVESIPNILAETHATTSTDEEATMLNELAVETPVVEEIVEEVSQELLEETLIDSLVVIDTISTTELESIVEEETKIDVNEKVATPKLEEKKEILREKNGTVNVVTKREDNSSLETIEEERLVSFNEIKKSVKKDRLERGMYCMLEEVEYAPGEYLLDPAKTKYLEPLAKLMKDNPSLKMEIAAHTVSIGYDDNNLEISKKRAKAVFNYMLYKDIKAERMSYIGLGETKPLNHCENGVVCSEEEHMVNQRVEVRFH